MTSSVPPRRFCFGWVQPFGFAVQEAQEFAVKLAGATADQDKARRLEGETRDLQAAHVHIEQVRAGSEIDMVYTERPSIELRCVWFSVQKVRPSRQPSRCWCSVQANS